MNSLRELSRQERDLIAALLQAKAETRPLIVSLGNLRVEEMNDGGMGSLRLIPNGLEGENRLFGKQISLGEFIDKDGTPVSVAVNVDKQVRLFELDIWKVNFKPLINLPDASTLTMKE
jgi:hypothetical protein